jgi:hypothetical protein
LRWPCSSWFSYSLRIALTTALEKGAETMLEDML